MLTPDTHAAQRDAPLPWPSLHQIPAYLTLLIGGMAVILAVVSFFSLRGPVPALLTLLDGIVGMVFLVFGGWIYRRPTQRAPRILVVSVLTLASTVALTVVPQTFLIPVTTLPLLIALIMFERIEVVVFQPFYLMLVVLVTPFSSESVSITMLFFQLLIFLAMWLSQARTQYQERLAAHERIHRALAELKQEQDAQQRQLIGVFQHELRNTADGMAGLVPLVRLMVAELAPSPPPDQTTAVSIDALLDGIERNAAGLSHLTQQLLLLSRSGDVAIVQAPCLVGPLLRQARMEAHSRASAHQLPISATVEIADETLTMAGDAQWLTLALRTATRNAFDSLSSVGAGQLTLRALATDTTIALQIADTGPGFTATQLEQIAEVVASGDVLRWTTKMGGSGLGIACMVQVMRLHHGQVVFENAPGGGAQVSLIVARTEAPR